MYGLFYTWHGWIVLAVFAVSGFCAIYRLRHLLEEWVIGVAVAGVIIVGACAGHLVSHYEGAVQRAGMMSQVSRGQLITRVPVIEWVSGDGNKHTTRVTRELMETASAGQTIRKRIGHWYPELLPENARNARARQ